MGYREGAKREEIGRLNRNQALFQHGSFKLLSEPPEVYPSSYPVEGICFAEWCPLRMFRKKRLLVGLRTR